MDTWQLQEAKARLSELVRKAQHAPQIITVRGEEEAVVLSKKDYEKLGRKKPSLVEFIRNSPLYGVDIEFERDKSPPREIEDFE